MKVSLIFTCFQYFSQITILKLRFSELLDRIWYELKIIDQFSIRFLNLIYNVVLQQKRSVAAPRISRKFCEKGLDGQIWSLIIIRLQFCDFEVLVVLPFSKISENPYLRDLWFWLLSKLKFLLLYLVLSQINYQDILLLWIFGLVFQKIARIYWNGFIGDVKCTTF